MPHLTRYSMYRQLFRHFPQKMRGTILGVSGIQHFYPCIHRDSTLEEKTFPELDMQHMPYPDGHFDYVISDQVIEHVYDPQQAIDESYRVLKTGGVAIHTTCFMNGVHTYPVDLWRFTPVALKHLCRRFPTIVACAGWGNRFALLLCCLSSRFRSMRIPDRRLSLRHWLATYNEDCYPIVSWIIAKK